MVGKEVEIIVLLLPLCYTIKEIRAASAMTRLEAHFFQEGAAGKGQKTIRAANGILKPRKIRACKTRISEHEPRKGTETLQPFGNIIAAYKFQNTNPERGRKPSCHATTAILGTSFQNTNPERGRKPQRYACSSLSREYFRTRTPKGDGNNEVSHRSRQRDRDFRTRTPKGDGNSQSPQAVPLEP